VYLVAIIAGPELVDVSRYRLPGKFIVAAFAVEGVAAAVAREMIVAGISDDCLASRAARAVDVVRADQDQPLDSAVFLPRIIPNPADQFAVCFCGHQLK
jgi:hypothetical protein